MRLGGRMFGGYTVVEVMMFLAVSGGLFIVAMTFIGGRQNQAYFTSALREFQQQIEDIVNDVTTGYYPPVSFACSYTGGIPGNALDFSGTVKDQGTRDNCTFLGKAVHFNFTNKKDFTVIPVTGGRLNSNSQPVINFDEANPKPLGSEFISILGVSSFPSGMTETFNLKGGLEFTAIYATTPSETYPSAFGIFTNFGNENPGITPGSLYAGLTSIPGSSYTPTVDSILNTGTKIDSMKNTGVPISPNISVIICLRQGTGGKKAALILGAKDRGLFSELAINDADAKVAEVGIGGVTTCPA